MKIAIRVHLFILIGIVSFSCGNTGKEKASESTAESQEEEVLYQEMMEIHDEAMPKMDDIMRLKGQIKNQLEDLEDSTQADQYKKAIEDLENADEAMMEWMRNLKPKDSLGSHQEIINYYREQKREIEVVRDEMLKAIEDGEEVLRK